VIPAPVDYVRPASLDEALAELADPDAKALAGGHSLVPMMKLRLARPSRLVDLAALGLVGVTVEGPTIRIGAMTTYDELLSTAAGIPDALRESAAAVGDVQVRNAGTVGGALAHGDPASDLAAGVIAAGATLVVRSAGGERAVAADDFFLGPFTTALGPQELLVELQVPAPAPGSGSAYVSFDDPASGYPLAGAAVRVEPDGSRVVALTGIGPHPQHAHAVEAALAGGGDPTDALQAIVGADDEDAAYRCQLAAVAVERALAAAERRRA
jgi:carbon-monoxide dehydrogenase medium subunit